MKNTRTERKTNKKIVATRSSRTTRKITAEETSKVSPRRSYTSLILGVVVVVITSLLLIAFLRNRTNMTAPQSTKDISTAMKVGPTISLGDSISERNSDTAANQSSDTGTPSVAPIATPTITVSPTPAPTGKPTIQPTVVPTSIIAKATVAPTTAPVAKPTAVAMTQSGQAEKFYNSGYNWVDIAKANNITDANIIYTGMKLQIPSVEKKFATVTVTPTQTAMSNMNKPAQNQPKTYTVKAGDDLWDVAVAVYKDGYRWSEIAKANNLTNPNVIHSGNVLNIP
jgi:nucleoid-associated protein YgaU